MFQLPETILKSPKHVLQDKGGFSNFRAEFPTPRQSSSNPQVNIILQREDPESTPMQSSSPTMVLATPLTNELVDMELARDQMQEQSYTAW
jgi:hypothetical protein